MIAITVRATNVSHQYVVGIVVKNGAHLQMLGTYSIYAIVLQVWYFPNHSDQFIFLDYESAYVIHIVERGEVYCVTAHLKWWLDNCDVTMFETRGGWAVECKKLFFFTKANFTILIL